jgi:Tfp pilus tip-associated adhesin PilY1
MLITEKVFLTINNRYVKYYKDKGYDVKGGQEIEVKISDLTNSSNILIEAKCDCCNEKKEMMYVAYNRYTKNETEEYYCQKCNNIKRKITVKEKYGVDNILESEIIKEKVKNTMIEKYGNEHALNIKEFKDKMKDTNNKKFGCDYASQNSDIKNKIKATFLENYGVYTSLLDKTTQEKISNTNIGKYGYENVSKNIEIKNKKIKKSLQNYGVCHPMKSNIIIKKIKKTNLLKYGHENPMSNDEVKNKMVKTKQQLGIYLQDSDRTEFINYKLKVKSLTNKNKKELFEKWSGDDYYDNEYIRDNKINDRNHPTIDHKISIKYGFENNITPAEISKIENLCITKRYLNSSKGSNCR